MICLNNFWTKDFQLRAWWIDLALITGMSYVRRTLYLNTFFVVLSGSNSMSIILFDIIYLIVDQQIWLTYALNFQLVNTYYDFLFL